MPEPKLRRCLRSLLDWSHKLKMSFLSFSRWVPSDTGHFFLLTISLQNLSYSVLCVTPEMGIRDCNKHIAYESILSGQDQNRFTFGVWDKTTTLLNMFPSTVCNHELLLIRESHCTICSRHKLKLFAACRIYSSLGIDGFGISSIGSRGLRVRIGARFF